MKRILQLLFVSSLTFFPARSIAQFHTIVKDNDTKATKEKTNNVPKKRLDEEDYFFNYPQIRNYAPNMIQKRK